MKRCAHALEPSTEGRTETRCPRLTLAAATRASSSRGNLVFPHLTATWTLLPSRSTCDEVERPCDECERARLAWLSAPQHRVPNKEPLLDDCRRVPWSMQMRTIATPGRLRFAAGCPPVGDGVARGGMRSPAAVAWGQASVTEPLARRRGTRAGAAPCRARPTVECVLCTRITDTVEPVQPRTATSGDPPSRVRGRRD